MRRISRAALGLLAFVAASHTGCASISGQQARPATGAAAVVKAGGAATADSRVVPASATETVAPGSPQASSRRAAYVEERYRDEYDPAPKNKPTGLDALSGENIKSNFKEMTGRGRNPAIARQLFIEAEELYAKAQTAEGELRIQTFAEAGAKYQEAAERWPGSLLEEDAQFMSGEAYFFADEYPKANEQYEKLVKQHPNTRHMDVVDAHRFSIAEYWLKLDKDIPDHFYSLNLTDKRRPWRDTSGNAFRVFDRIRIDDPTGKLSDDATLAAANAHFAAGDYFKADALYTDLRKTFPSSEHQFLAHFFGLKTKLMCYEGAEYGGDALDQAEQLIKQIRRQFPQQAEQEKKYLVEAYAEIRYKKAERLWTRGRYHELRLEYRAAKFYFDQLLAEFPDTPFAEQSKEHLAANSDKPPVPPQRLEWLVNLFPKRETAKPLFPNDAPIVPTTKR